MKANLVAIVKRTEFGVAAVAALIIAALICLDIWAKHSLVNSEAFNVGSNLIQYSSGPALFVGIAMAAWTRWHRTCKVPYCLRLGIHPVAGTTWKVCPVHHTRDLRWHWLVADRHAVKHPDRAGHGDTHK